MCPDARRKVCIGKHCRQRNGEQDYKAQEQCQMAISSLQSRCTVGSGDSTNTCGVEQIEGSRDRKWAFVILSTSGSD